MIASFFDSSNVSVTESSDQSPVLIVENIPTVSNWWPGRMEVRNHGSVKTRKPLSCSGDFGDLQGFPKVKYGRNSEGTWKAFDINSAFSGSARILGRRALPRPTVPP